MSRTMVTSHSASTLLEMYSDQHQHLTSPGSGIDLAAAVKDMLYISIKAANLYDTTYLKSKKIDTLIQRVMEDPEELTLKEANLLANSLGSRLFLSFLEHQLDYANSKAWDLGVSHALEVRQKMSGLFKLTEVLTDNPLEGKIIGQVV